eukprot:9245858-Pyramimonas_sp.AAC.1
MHREPLGSGGSGGRLGRRGLLRAFWNGSTLALAPPGRGLPDGGAVDGVGPEERAAFRRCIADASSTPAMHRATLAWR